MGLFDRFRRRSRRGGPRPADDADVAHLKEWAAQHRGVEAFLEPRTTVTETTLVLVAHDGEWTRRRIDGMAGAQKLTRQLGIPLYEVERVGYPKRMREYNARQRIRRNRTEAAGE
ncbi:MAG TPA: oxidoreductase [Pseudonocardiaceae bacterium]